MLNLVALLVSGDCFFVGVVLVASGCWSCQSMCGSGSIKQWSCREASRQGNETWTVTVRRRVAFTSSV